MNRFRMPVITWPPSGGQVLLLLVILLPSFSTASAQWRRQLRVPGWVRNIYFLDLPGAPRVGFASVLAVPTENNRSLYRTADGGASWHPIPLPFVSFNHTDAYFKDSLTGWVTTGGYFGTPRDHGGILKTTDQGLSWAFLPSPIPYPNGIHYSTFSGLLMVTGPGPEYYDYYSPDDGVTWLKMTPAENSLAHFAFATPQSGVIADIFPPENNESHFWRATNDGGKTWDVLSLDSNSYHPLAIEGTETYFALTTHGHVLRTDDKWKTWNVLYEFPWPESIVRRSTHLPTTGTVCGSLKDMFVQTGDGIFYSSDEGISWKYLCGPISSEVNATRFYAKDRQVYCGSFLPDNPLGSLWYFNLDSLDIPTDISCRFGNGLAVTQPDSRSEVRIVAQVLDRATDSLHFRIRYDADAFRWSRADLPDGWKASARDDGAGVVELTITKNGTPSNDSTFGLIFSTVLSKERAEIIIESQKVFSYEFAAECIASEYQRPDTLTVEFGGCGDPLLLSYMRTHKLFDILSASPNPAATQVTLEVARHLEGPIRYELLNILGTTEKAGEFSSPKLSLDVASLPNGSYLLRLSQNGAVQTREVVISR